MPSQTTDEYDFFAYAYDKFNEELFEGKLPGCVITLQRKGNSFGYYSPDRFVGERNGFTDEIAMNPEYFASRPVEDVLSTLGHEMCHQWRERNGEPMKAHRYHDTAWAEKMRDIGLEPSNTGSPGGKTTGEKMSHYINPEGLFIKVCKKVLKSKKGIAWFDRNPRPCSKNYTYAGSVEVPGSQSAGVNEDDQDQQTMGSSEKESVFSSIPLNNGLNVVQPPERNLSSDGKTKPAMQGNRVKFVCPSCSDAAWGKPSLFILCGNCNKPFEPATA